MYPAEFDYAVNHLMLYEVGPFWELTPEVEAGMIDTAKQRKSVGYVNDPLDRGGETKFGISQNAVDVDVTNLTWPQAKDIYFTEYWSGGKCNQLPPRVAILHFDGCVNHGINRANKILQKAVGTTADGVIGALTIDAINNIDAMQLCDLISAQRVNFYKNIVNRNPDQARFLNGWLRRVDEMRILTTDPSLF